MKKRELRTEIEWSRQRLFDDVEENVASLKMFTNDNKAVLKERVDFVLERVALTDAHKLPSQFLRNAKRVAIARAIVNRPKYLFCDEPNSGLDPNTAILIDNLIKEITEEYDHYSN
jgi:phospholipid/cholesterol/gamma-HCH transport system ATP-binding protein